MAKSQTKSIFGNFNHFYCFTIKKFYPAFAENTDLIFIYIYVNFVIIFFSPRFLTDTHMI